MGSLIAVASQAWDRMPVDEPPTGFMEPLLQSYFMGHNAVDFVS